jgi:hypothetical protein
MEEKYKDLTTFETMLLARLDYLNTTLYSIQKILGKSEKSGEHGQK